MRSRIYNAIWNAAPPLVQDTYAYATLRENGEWSVIQDIDPNAVRQVPLYTHPPKPESITKSISDIDIEKLYQNLSCDISIGQLEEIVGMIESFSRN